MTTPNKKTEEMIPKSVVDKRMAEMEAFFAKKFEELEKKVSVQEKDNGSIEVEQPVIVNKNEDVRLDDYVEVMSLCPMPLNLSTQGNGRGKLFKFNKFGDKKSILYRDLADIIENHRSFVEGGVFYIMNPTVVRKNGLDYIYENILTKEKIQDILVKGNREAISLFETATEKQKELIIEMILQKLSEDIESLDLNIVDKISKISKVDILAKVNYSKELLEVESEK